MNLSDDLLMDLDAVVERSGLSRRTWRRILRSGEVGYLRLAGSVRIPKSEFEKYLALRFTPARAIAPQPVDIVAVLDQVVPRKCGRPRSV